MKDAYDIYIAADVDALKADYQRLRRQVADTEGIRADYAKLKQRWREVVHENAMLEERLNRIERARCFEVGAP